MATGEKTFSTTERTVAKNDIPLIPKGEYEGRIGKAEVRTADGVGKIPYVALQIPVAGTALTEGGKDRLVFCNILCSLDPGKDGIANTDRANGLVALAKALGTELEGIPVVTRTVNIDGKNVEQTFVDPVAVRTWLESQSGAMFGLKIKEQAARGDYGAKNEVDKFLPPR